MWQVALRVSGKKKRIFLRVDLSTSTHLAQSSQHDRATPTTRLDICPFSSSQHHLRTCHRLSPFLSYFIDILFCNEVLFASDIVGATFVSNKLWQRNSSCFIASGQNSIEHGLESRSKRQSSRFHMGMIHKDMISMNDMTAKFGASTLDLLLRI